MAAGEIRIEEIRDSIIRIADTPDGERFFEWLAQERFKAFKGITTGEGPALLRLQGGYNLLTTIFNTHNVTSKKPQR